jgi:aspartyl protease family protein
LAKHPEALKGVGRFKSKLAVWNPATPSRVEELELLVHTGASYSWFLRQRLETLGIRPTGKMQFRTIDGRILERDVGPVFVRTNGHVGGDTIVMAESGDAEALGAHPWESLGLAADPVQKKLIPTVGMAFTGQMRL